MINSPYKFLDFYGIDDQNIFFGRDKETNILVADIVVNRLVVLFARTGTGKTSLMNAGVRPRLEARDFRTFYIRVEQDPTKAARAVLRRENLLEDEQETMPLSKQLCSVVESLNKSIVLFFDQFEEFFIQIADRQRRREFIKDISDVYRNAESGVHLVFSMREEYFHEMDEFREDIPSIFHKNSNLRLLPLDEDQARAAIIKPAAALGVEIDLSLANEIIKDLKNDKDGIRAPSLQIVCDTLWRKEAQADRHITIRDYEELGRAESILDQRLAQDIEQALADTDLLPLMQRLLPELQTGEGTKYPRVFSDLVATLDTTDEILRDLITRLKDTQIIKGMTISGAEAVEWASDYLAEQTSNLLRLVKKIELKRLLIEAIGKSKDVRVNIEKRQASGEAIYIRSLTEEELNSLYLPEDIFMKLSQNIEYLPELDADETLIFLFEATLYHQQHLKLWFNRLSHSSFGPYNILRNKIHGQENHIDSSLGAVKLLSELATDEAVALLNDALDIPDLASKAIDALVDIIRDSTTQLLAKALDRDDLWQDVLGSLARSGTERAITLLEPLLTNDDKSLQVLDTLDSLTKSRRGRTSTVAKEALTRAVVYFTAQLEQKDRAAYAQNILKHIVNYADGQAKEIAKKAIQGARTPAKPEEESAGLSSSGTSVPTRGSQALPKIISLRNISKVVPVISDSIRIEQIFKTSKELVNRNNEIQQMGEVVRSVKEQLTKLWARKLQYPMSDDYDLARVAQYNQIEHDGSDIAEEQYLEFLKMQLLKMNESDKDYGDVVERLRKETLDLQFSKIVRELDYPRFTPGVEDPLRLLASLPFSVYITTSYYDFLESELNKQNRIPRTQVIFWEEGREYDDATHHYPDPNFLPTPQEPAVYHIYGLENYPGSLVLSEDDHMKFLVSVIGDTDMQKPIVPTMLRRALASSHLIFLGYNFGDWDFRILFQFILNYRRGESGKQGIFVDSRHLGGEDQHITNYLRHYFNMKRFEVEWRSSESFIQEVWDIYKGQEAE